MVIAGETSVALPANGCMNCIHCVAASCGLVFPCEDRSGSLMLHGPRQCHYRCELEDETHKSRCVLPLAIAAFAFAAHCVLCSGAALKSIGKNVTPAGRSPWNVESQSYANETCLSSRAS